MNGFNLSDIQDAKLGATTLGSIYLGSNKIWPLIIDYSQEYLTIKSLADNNTIRFKKEAMVEPSEAKTIYWSSDKTTWHSVSSDSGTIKTLSNNEKIYIKGNNNYYSSNEWGWNCFKSDYEFNISGNIMSLIYGDNFIGQTTLPSVPYNFSYIFTHSKVVDASNLILPATTLADYCYCGMFYSCTSLTAPPELPATTLSERCYSDMFDGCKSLTIAPELPATTLADDCYDNMFYGCTSLTTAPELPATTLANYCYQSMFQKCTSLSYIKMLATDISATSCLNSWVYNVASTGTFVKDYNLKSIPINSESGIPTGWTIEEVNRDYSQEYFTIESLEDNNRILWKLNGSSGAKSISYSTDKINWTSVTSSSSGNVVTTLNTGDKVYIRGNNSAYGVDTSNYNTLSSDGQFKVYGNIMSLLYSDNFTSQYTLSNDFSFFRFFMGSKITDASNLILPATTLAGYCYGYMFGGCTSLTAPPELPATTLADSCYRNMFRGCTSLTAPPELPATTLAGYCYGYMFRECTSLTAPPELPATTLASNCYQYIFYGCTNLTTAPELSATTLTTGCYAYMFYGCTSLTAPPELPATTLASNCYREMFDGCTSLSYIKCLATNISAIHCLDNWVTNVAATGTFVKPSSMTSWTSGTSGIPSGWTVENI